ncbi:hypothetical protein JOQ06_006988, partial [Pogonophryne albipinna]
NGEQRGRQEEAAPTSCYQRFYQLPADCNGSELEEGEERALMLEDAASIQSFVGRVSKDYQVANWQYQSLLQAHT